MYKSMIIIAIYKVESGYAYAMGRLRNSSPSLIAWGRMRWGWLKAGSVHFNSVDVDLTGKSGFVISTDEVCSSLVAVLLVWLRNMLVQGSGVVPRPSQEGVQC